MMINSSDLWCTVLRSKYQMENYHTDIKCNNTYSYIWKAIVKCMPDFLDTSIRRIGNGETIQAWNDSWVETDKNIVGYELDIPSDSQNARVCVLVNDNSDWNRNLMKQWIPTS